MDVGDASVVSLYPADGQARALWLAPAGAAAPPGPAIGHELWQWGEVRSGIATVTAPVVEAFVPQMLNYESVGGVNFKKGCYPGQEIVARSQFRGTLKRRAYLAHSQAALQAGQEVFHESDPEQPCGLVVAGRARARRRLGRDRVDADRGLAGGRPDGRQPAGPGLKVQPLPYPLLADV